MVQEKEGEFMKINILGERCAAFDEILTPDALQFIAKLTMKFNDAREKLLYNRVIRQKELDTGKLPRFLTETREIREGDWTIAPIPLDLQDRRVEITGPASDRKLVINALNSGAKVFMADFEDANSPTWKNTIQGQINLRDAIRRTIQFVNLDGKQYKLKEQIATLIVRPRGWHLNELHVTVNGKPVPGGLFDFGLYFFHNVHKLLELGTGPYFYLPKIENHLEARLWNEVFVFAQEELGIPQGTIKATVLIETILAAFEMDEILYELREHSAGLNCGRWDYIFSYLKKLRNQPEFILPNREQVTMTTPFMRAYTLLAIKTCHRRNAPCIGGMAAQIPVKNNPEANEIALTKVRVDKEREALDGHDGTWVAHPGLVSVAKDVFDQIMFTPNQITKLREDVEVTAEDLLQVPSGTITEEGVRSNIRVGIQYIEAWLRGNGAVAINHLMEDAATAEISRAQVWHWIRHPKGVLDDGRKVTAEMVMQFLKEEIQVIRLLVGEKHFQKGKFEQAKRLFVQLILDDEFKEFLTIPGYEYLVNKK
ncbi:malate synthase A [Thermoflavimicrobium daqui]|uniref:Malate synthase n=2 Tax=Thermoflavimicrobium daqui TaxID=2137476 RepID=A0A364K9T3_9BACL|nr:malate synthase A [Thermoflavimicrobium daqui]